MTTKGPEVTVIIPTRNRPAETRAAVSSCLTQGPNVRIIVVDDGSTDGTADGLPVVDRVKVLRTSHGGPCRSRNLGAAASASTFLAFLDSDDRLEPHWYETFRPRLTGSVALVRADGTVVPSKGGTYPLGHPRWIGAYPEGAVIPGTWIVSNDLFSAAGGYDEQLRFSENTELLIRLHRQATAAGVSVVHVPTPVVIVNRREGRSAEYGPSPGLAAERMLARHPQVFRTHPELHARYLSIAAAAAHDRGDHRLATLRSGRALVARPSRHNALRLGRALLRLVLNALRRREKVVTGA